LNGNILHPLNLNLTPQLSANPGKRKNLSRDRFLVRFIVILDVVGSTISGIRDTDDCAREPNLFGWPKDLDTLANFGRGFDLRRWRF